MMRNKNSKRIIVWCLSFLLACQSFCGWWSQGSTVSRAATFDQVNQASVFLKQEQGSNTCTLVAATMLVRRAAMLAGNADWAAITTDVMTSAAWTTGVGLKWDFNCGGVTVTHGNFSGSVTELATLLGAHPEGIVLYKQKKDQQHALLITDYTDGIFYCADPSAAMPAGRIPISSASIKVEDSNYIWYVTSPELYLTDASGNVIAHPQVEVPAPTATPTETPKPTASPSATPKKTSEPKKTTEPGNKTKTQTAKEPTAPKKVTNFKVTNIKKRTLSASWDKVSGASGYQLLYGTDITFDGCASISQNKKKCKMKKLKKGACYYVKVRAYKMDGDSRVYGACSKVKKIKVKV